MTEASETTDVARALHLAQEVGYGIGYADGESNRETDWQFALDEVADLEDPDPMTVARLIADLRSWVRKYQWSGWVDDEIGCPECGMEEPHHEPPCSVPRLLGGTP